MDPFLIDSDFSDEDAPAARPDAAPAAEGDAPQPASAPHVEAPEALQTVVASPSPAAPAIGHDQGRSAAEGVQAQADATAEPAAEEPVDLERERQARIARNRQALQALGVAQAAAELREDRNDSTAVVKKKRTRQREPREAAPAPPVQLKRSRRLAGVAAENDENADGEQAPPPEPEVPVEEKLLTCEEYCDLKGIPRGHPVDGRFRGWVEEGVCKRIGVALTAEEHWEKWGGNVQVKPPKGQSAKDFSKTQLTSNPNQYFYRHNEPGEEEWHGEWSEEEVQKFVEVAKQYGCGNKWGLFASHIPHRVGYQCSAAHRHIMLPRGLLMDNNFKMTADGKTRWVGGRGGGDD